MKRLIFITLALLSASLACNISLPNTISGSGNIVTASYEVDDSNQVELNTIGEACYPLDRIAAAHRHAENRHAKGKVVVQIQNGQCVSRNR